MRYVKKRYRIFYLIPLTLSLIGFVVMQLIKFVMLGTIPDVHEISMTIEESLEGKYYKVFVNNRGEVFRGEELEKL